MVLLNETIYCYKCGKSEKVDAKVKRKILFLYHWNDGRKPTCTECSIVLSKEGKIPCVHRYGHHLGSTCDTCEQKD